MTVLNIEMRETPKAQIQQDANKHEAVRTDPSVSRCGEGRVDA